MLFLLALLILSKYSLFSQTKVDSIAIEYLVKRGDLDSVVNVIKKEKGLIIKERNFGLFKKGTLKFDSKNIDIYIFSSSSQNGIHILMIDKKNNSSKILEGVNIEEDVSNFFKFLNNEFGKVDSDDKRKLLKRFLILLDT